VYNYCNSRAVCFIQFALADKNHSPLAQDMFNSEAPMHPSILNDYLVGKKLGKYGFPELKPFGFSAFQR
jgi:hypothetical protein